MDWNSNGLAYQQLRLVEWWRRFAIVNGNTDEYCNHWLEITGAIVSECQKKSGILCIFILGLLCQNTT